MALFTPQDPQGIATLTAHIHNTFILEALQANMAHANWAFLHEGLPRAHQTGANVSVPIEGALPVTDAVLAPDADGTPLASSDSAALIPCPGYGHYLLLTDDCIVQKDMNTMDAKARALAIHAQRKQDLIAGTAAVAGSNVVFKNGRADEDALVVGDVIDASDFVAARAFLDGGEAPTFQDGLYRAILSPYQIADLFNDGAVAKGFLQQTAAVDPGAFITALVGSWHGFNIYRASQLTTVTLGADEGAADLIRAVFCGAEYLDFAQREPIKFFGPELAGDVMKQQWVLGYKGRFGYGRVKEANGMRREYRSAFSPNP